MNVKKLQRYEAWAHVIKAMAHPTRLLLVDELIRCRERCVCELTNLVGADISTVSRHLQVLKEVGIIADEKRGNTVLYRLHCKQVDGLISFMECCLRSTGAA